MFLTLHTVSNRSNLFNTSKLLSSTISDFLNSPNLKLYHHLSLSFFEKIRLPDIPKDIPRHIPIPIPAMLFKTFIKTTLQSIAAIIPIVTPIIILLLFISFILHKFRFVKLNTPIIPYIGRFACPFYVIFLQYKRSNPSSPMVTDESDLL